MPIQNCLLLASIVPPGSTLIQKGDMVFSLTYRSSSGQVGVSRFVHVGIATDDIPAHHLGEPVNVIHLGAQAIEHEPWEDVPPLRIDIVGTMPSLDFVTRSAIIDAAAAFYQLTPTVLAQNQCCYLMGDPHPNGHPINAGVPYGFSCATFAHYCYSMALPQNSGPVVATDSMPLISAEEHEWLRSNLHYPIQPYPFRRLYPSYLIRAFEIDQYPFSPVSWEEWKHHNRYVDSFI